MGPRPHRQRSDFRRGRGTAGLTASCLPAPARTPPQTRDDETFTSTRPTSLALSARGLVIHVSSEPPPLDDGARSDAHRSSVAPARAARAEAGEARGRPALPPRGRLHRRRGVHLPPTPTRKPPRPLLGEPLQTRLLGPRRGNRPGASFGSVLRGGVPVSRLRPSQDPQRPWSRVHTRRGVGPSLRPRHADTRRRRGDSAEPARWWGEAPRTTRGHGRGGALGPPGATGGEDTRATRGHGPGGALAPPGAGKRGVRPGGPQERGPSVRMRASDVSAARGPEAYGRHKRLLALVLPLNRDQCSY